MNSSDPVTKWVAQLKKGDLDAARRLFDLYYGEIVAEARRELRDFPRRVEDEEDAALSAFKSFFHGVENDKFEQLDDRQDLWQILLMLVHRKAVDQIRRQNAQRRGKGNVKGGSGLQQPRMGDSSDGAGFQPADTSPTPATTAQVEEETKRLMSLLASDELRKTAAYKLQGYKNAEIAELLDISKRSVERGLALIRKTWDRELDR